MSEPRLEGQWIGESEGEPRGKAVIDIDRVPAGWRGTAYLFPDDQGLPSSLLPIYVEAGGMSDIQGFPTQFDARNGARLSHSVLQRMFPDAQFPERLTYSLKMSDDILEVEWDTSIGTYGSARLRRSRIPATSRINADENVRTWADFKAAMQKKKFGEFLFRGQSEDWPLQTSFHRTSRNDLNRYLDEDIPALHRAITGRMRHVFDLDRPLQLGAFMNLIQHHGYPTPMLDWTYSPFVAAWFAFESAISRSSDKTCVRIFCLSKDGIRAFSQFLTITLAPLHFSLLEALAIENDRALPQQGCLTLTNVNDIEAHLIELQKQLGSPIVSAFDLPAREAKSALNDLALMGITRATLFPSIESVCKDLRDRNFNGADAL